MTSNHPTADTEVRQERYGEDGEETDHVDEQKFHERLPAVLRDDISIHLHYETLLTVPVFQAAQANVRFIRAIAKRLLWVR